MRLMLSCRFIRRRAHVARRRALRAQCAVRAKKTLRYDARHRLRGARALMLMPRLRVMPQRYMHAGAPCRGGVAAAL